MVAVIAVSDGLARWYLVIVDRNIACIEYLRERVEYFPVVAWESSFPMRVVSIRLAPVGLVE